MKSATSKTASYPLQFLRIDLIILQPRQSLLDPTRPQMLDNLREPRKVLQQRQQILRALLIRLIRVLPNNVPQVLPRIRFDTQPRKLIPIPVRTADAQYVQRVVRFVLHDRVVRGDHFHQAFHQVVHVQYYRDGVEGTRVLDQPDDETGHFAPHAEVAGIVAPVHQGLQELAVR